MVQLKYFFSKMVILYSPTEAKLVQIALWLGGNQTAASMVGAYRRKGWAQAVRNWPMMATMKPDLSKTPEHTMGCKVLR